MVFTNISTGNGVYTYFVGNFPAYGSPKLRSSAIPSSEPVRFSHKQPRYGTKIWNIQNAVN
jgi:hypothetical protein